MTDSTDCGYLNWGDQPGHDTGPILWTHTTYDAGGVTVGYSTASCLFAAIAADRDAAIGPLGRYASHANYSTATVAAGGRAPAGRAVDPETVYAVTEWFDDDNDDSDDDDVGDVGDGPPALFYSASHRLPHLPRMKVLVRPEDWTAKATELTAFGYRLNRTPSR